VDWVGVAERCEGGAQDVADGEGGVELAMFASQRE